MLLKQWVTIYMFKRSHELTRIFTKLSFPFIWKKQVVLVVGVAYSRDHLISRLEAAPTGGFLW